MLPSLTVHDFGYTADCLELDALAREWFANPGYPRMMAVWNHMDPERGTCDLCKTNRQAIADFEEWQANPEAFVVTMTEVINDPISL